MKESSTYQAILEEGEGRGAVREARKLLHKFGGRAFGPPNAQITAAIEGINDLTRLEELCDRLETAGSWQELLSEPPAGRRRGRPQ